MDNGGVKLYKNDKFIRFDCGALNKSIISRPKQVENDATKAILKG